MFTQLRLIGALVGVLVLVAVGFAGYHTGKSAQRDHDDAEIAKERDARRDNSVADERTIATLSGSIDAAVAAKLNQGDRAAAPIIVGMHDAIRSSPVATDARCSVPASVLESAASLYRAAERAAEDADSAGVAFTGGAGAGSGK